MRFCTLILHFLLFFFLVFFTCHALSAADTQAWMISYFSSWHLFFALALALGSMPEGR